MIEAQYVQARLHTCGDGWGEEAMGSGDREVAHDGGISNSRSLNIAEIAKKNRVLLCLTTEHYRFNTTAGT